MAASASVVSRGAAGELFFRLVDVTLDGSYPAGGYPLVPKEIGFGTNGVVVHVDGAMSKTGGWTVGYDHTTGKLQVFDGSGAANAIAHEVAPATVLTGVVARLMVWGKGQG